MSGIKSPRDAYRAGTKACMRSCTIVTKPAITTIKLGIRTASGTRCLIIEITVFEQMRTNMVASPIAIPFAAELVVARVGHMPSRRTKVGFSVVMPLRIISNGFIDAGDRVAGRINWGDEGESKQVPRQTA